MSVIFGYSAIDNSGIIALILVGAFVLYSLMKDHVVHDKIESIYNRVVKKHPF